MIRNPQGIAVGEAGAGNRKDIRNAVEAAHAGSKWTGMTGHSKAQVLYYLAENLQARSEEFKHKLMVMCDLSSKSALEEVQLSIQRVFYYAAWADKYDGLVHSTIQRNVTLAMPEPIGTMGIIAPNDFPLLGFISTVIPALAMGNRVVVVPSELSPLAATDFYQVMDTSDLPAGALNIVTGASDDLAKVLADHYDIDGIWYFGNTDISAHIEKAAADNMKRTWVNHGKIRDWRKEQQGFGEQFLREATQIKNIWIPYGA